MLAFYSDSITKHLNHADYTSLSTYHNLRRRICKAKRRKLLICKLCRNVEGAFSFLTTSDELVGVYAKLIKS